MPKRLRLLSKDPKLVCDQEFQLEWKEVVLFSAKSEEDGVEVKYSNLKAGPFPLSVKIQKDAL